MKWFELLKQEYDCPVVMLHVPYQGDGVITDAMRELRRRRSCARR